MTLAASIRLSAANDTKQKGARAGAQHYKMTSLRDHFRRSRIAMYHWRNGPHFYFAGQQVKVPDHMLGMKRLLIKDEYERAERIMVERYLDRSLPLIELGGSLGILSSLLARTLDAGVRYDIVEANPKLIEICRENATIAHPVCNVHVHNLAVAYSADEVCFQASDNVHVSKLSRNGNVTVPASTLTNLLSKVGKPEPYTLVMDIEGAEYEVLENDPHAFEGCALAIIEIHPKVFAERQKSETDFIALAARAGLKAFDRIENTLAFRKR